MSFFRKRKGPDPESVFPYTMDTMAELDIDILLKQPTMLVLSMGGNDRDKFIRRILETGSQQLPKETKFYIVQEITGALLEGMLEPLFFTGLETQRAVETVHAEMQNRLSYIRQSAEKMYKGPPIYFLTDSFTMVQTKAHDLMGVRLSEIIMCARQANIHTIVFEYPHSFHSTETGAFSSVAILQNAYKDKFRDKLNKDIFVSPGKFYLLPHFGKEGIYTI